MLKLKKIKTSKNYDLNTTYVIDFETTTADTEYFKTHNTGTITCWMAKNLTDTDKQYGLTMNDLENWFIELAKDKEPISIRIYAHNLGKFDGYILLSWGIENWSCNLNNIKSKFTFTYEKGAGNEILKLIIKYKKLTVIFVDSYKLINYSVAYLGKLFNFPKGEVDYKQEPVEKWEQLPLIYREYLERDVDIVIKALLQFDKALGDYENIDWKNCLTISSLSRQFIESVDTDKLFKISFKSQQIAKRFYRGGFTSYNKNYWFKKVENINAKMIDAKSHYPSVMKLNELPAGEPEPITEEEIDDYKIVFVKVVGHIKKCKTGWGTINKTSDFHHYIFEDNQDFIFVGLIQEWKIQKHFYEFSKWEYAEIWGFNETQNLLNEIIDKFYELKETSDTKLVWKLLLNSLYGSCGMKANYPDTYFINENEIPNLAEISTDKKQYYRYHIKARQFFEGLTEIEIDYDLLNSNKCWNIWVAASITSYGRYELMRHIAYKPDSVLYCDTDSMLILNDFPLEKVKLGKELGCWEVEKENINNIYIQGAKRYVVGQDEEVLKTGFAGVSKIKHKGEFNYMYNLLNTDIVEEAQLRTIIDKDFKWFPILVPVNYKNTKLIKWKAYNEKEKENV